MSTDGSVVVGYGESLQWDRSVPLDGGRAGWLAWAICQAEASSATRSTFPTTGRVVVGKALPIVVFVLYPRVSMDRRGRDGSTSRCARSRADVFR